jgi:biotin carboxyl carrier protein
MPRRLHVSEGDGDAGVTVELDGQTARFPEPTEKRLDSRPDPFVPPFVTIEEDGGRVTASDGARVWRGVAAIDADTVWVDLGGQVFECRVAARPRRAAARDADALMSPMPATVVRVDVEPGTAVAAGDVLVALEAMKMELPIRAPRDAVVRAVHCRPGDIVHPGHVLIDLD